jgi:hypothetical protein
MKNEISVPVYSSLEALLAAEAPTLRDRCLTLANELTNFDLDGVDDRDLKLALEGLTEANLVETAEALADLAAWFN